jgi:6-phosphofructokinase 1
VGLQAVEISVKQGGGWMATMLREHDEEYRVRYDKVPLELVANSERKFPGAWLTENRIDVTDDFVRYARPLIGDEWVRVPLEKGLQRFARFKPVFAEKKCPAYMPEAHR